MFASEGSEFIADHVTMTSVTNWETVVSADDDRDETAVMGRAQARGNVWFLDDFLCSGLAFNDLSEQDKRMVKWAITRRSVNDREGRTVLELIRSASRPGEYLYLRGGGPPQRRDDLVAY
jgi:phosphosulfolactate phosphohydrolase-like enzyme